MTNTTWAIGLVLVVVAVSLTLATIERGIVVRNIRQRVAERRRRRYSIVDHKKAVWSKH